MRIHPFRPFPITRTVLTRASAGVLMVWVSQLRRGPYSYDLIDNLGRRSPRVPDGASVAPGDQIMYIFTATQAGESHVEARMTAFPRWIFGAVTVRYDVIDYGQVRCLHYTMWVPGAGRFSQVRRYVLAWADLVMARKQLMTLTHLAEVTIEGTSTKE